MTGSEAVEVLIEMCGPIHDSETRITAAIELLGRSIGEQR